MLLNNAQSMRRADRRPGRAQTGGRNRVSVAEASVEDPWREGLATAGFVSHDQIETRDPSMEPGADAQHAEARRIHPGRGAVRTARDAPEHAVMVHTSRSPGASPADARLAMARIVRRRDVTDDLFVLWLEPDIRFNFTPGQYITVGTRGIERPYSIASAPYEPQIELFIEYVLPEHGGRLTPLLYTQDVGDVLTIRPKAKGRFTLRPGIRNHVMVATVTGIAPYVSMLRQFVHDRAHEAGNDCRFFVMQGASHRDEFVYDRELLQLSDAHPDVIQFVRSVSRPWAGRNAGWTGRTGRIHLLIDEYLETWRLPRRETVVYLCGNPGMIEDAQATLMSVGWSVAAERFWRL